MSRQDAAMKKTTAAENIYLYSFTDYDEKHSNTLTVLVDNNRALVIDPAYPEYAEKTREDLEQQGIKPEIVVLSHYHPDHVSGCSVFKDCQVYAGEYYNYNYENCHLWEPSFTYIRPTQMVRNNDTLNFGGFTLNFLHGPGHSKCSLITQITDKLFHVGDLIMICWDRKNSLPYIADGGSFKEHARSLRRIKELDPDAIVAPHGGLIDNKNRIHALVDDRLYYLEQPLNSRGALPLKECLKNDPSWYEHLAFHDTNIIQLL